MYQSSLFPLRTIVGNAILIRAAVVIEKVFESAESKKLEIDYGFSVKPFDQIHAGTPSLANTSLLDYLPTFGIEGTAVLPGIGMDTLPVPPRPLPFNNSDNVVSFSALSKKEKSADDVSRKLSARFKIHLPDMLLVGGICFGGYPYLPYSRSEAQFDGTNSSNYGLPREVRLTCSGAIAADEEDEEGEFKVSGFLDAETQATRQTIVSHSGFHFLCIEPTLTDSLMVHFSDYPTILKQAKFNDDTSENNQTLHYGFMIPHFYVFEYKEKTRYRPAVSAGVLGTSSNKELSSDVSQVTGANAFNDNVEYRHVIDNKYYDFTAASMFGQQRTYLPEEREQFKECFISTKIPPTKSVVLYIEQAEDYERCVAGLKILLPFFLNTNLSNGDVTQFRDLVGGLFDSPGAITGSGAIAIGSREDHLRRFFHIPPEIDFCKKIGLRVFEIDPLEGVSPLSVPLDGKYATLLAEQELDNALVLAPAFFMEGVKFVRPSNSKYFAVELTNLDSEPGQFLIKHLQLVQSAHVSIHPRAAKTQQVRTLNFRIIGPNLADDYALLGAGGFNFSIERFVAGERKSVLFRANSLLDLLHTGAAKIFSNVRRRAVEFERIIHNQSINNDENLGEGSLNYDIRHSEGSDIGWRRSETGRNVNTNRPITGPADWYGEMPHWNGEQNPNVPGEKGEKFSFSTLGSREIRSHLQNLLPELTNSSDDSNEWNAVFKYFNFVGALSTLGLSEDLVSLSNFKRLDSNNWANRAWIGSTAPRVGGQKSISFNPLAPLLDLTNFVDDIIQGRPFDGTLFGSMLLGNVPLLLSSGLNTSCGFLGVVTIGMQPVPVLNFTTTVGSAGSITKTASEENYSYSQVLNRSFAQSRGVSYADEGNQNRKIIRKEVPDTDHQRIKGAEVMWQGELMDIITGAIPLNLTLPATASKMHFRTSDDSLRVRFGSGVGRSISVDFWFDITEEVIRDDY